MSKYECHYVTKAEVCGPFSVRLEFDDGVRRRVNLRDELWGQMFAPLKDPKRFAKLRVDPDCGTIVWPNGADLAPEFLYSMPEEPDCDAARRSRPIARPKRRLTRRRRTRSRS